MIFTQYRGPFNKSLILSDISSSGSPVKLKYLQIGIEYPHSIPISEFEENDYSYIISINDSRYLITERDVLEFSNLSVTSFKIDFLKNSRYLIVNVTYEEAN